MKIAEYFKDLIQKNKEKHYTAQISKLAGYAWAVFKLIFGIVTASYFFCISGVYTFAVGLSKEVFFKGRKVCGDVQSAERKYYLKMCGILAVASVIYILYMLRLFFYPENPAYGDILSITIATMAFAELILAIINLSKANRKKDLLLNGLRCVNLASAFTAVVFAQIAILSFTSVETNMSRYNAISGAVFGAACLGICGYMLAKFIMTGKEVKGDIGQTEGIEPLQESFE